MANEKWIVSAGIKSADPINFICQPMSCDERLYI